VTDLRVAAQFTPGPWDMRGLTVFEHDKTSMSIAVVTQHEVNAKANARLIAAAPSLYDAASLFASSAVIDEHTHRVTVDEYVLSAVRAALAKARGEA
jgi:hypothetical protein